MRFQLTFKHPYGFSQSQLVSLIKQYRREFTVDDKDKMNTKLKTYLVGDLLVILEGIKVKIIWTSSVTLVPSSTVVISTSHMTPTPTLPSYITSTIYVRDSSVTVTDGSTRYVIYGRLIMFNSISNI